MIEASGVSIPNDLATSIIHTVQSKPKGAVIQIQFNSKQDAGKFLHFFMSQNIRNGDGQKPRYKFIEKLRNNQSLEQWKTIQTSPLLKVTNLQTAFDLNASHLIEWIQRKTSMTPEKVELRHHSYGDASFAYVRMKSPDDADIVITKLQRAPFHGRNAFISRINPLIDPNPRREYLKEYEYITKMVIYNLPHHMSNDKEAIETLCEQQGVTVRKVRINYQDGGYPRRSADILLKNHSDTVKLYETLHQHQIGSDVLTTGFVSDYPRTNVLGITGIPPNMKRPSSIKVCDFVMKATDQRPAQIRTYENGEGGWVVLVVFPTHQPVVQCMTKLAKRKFLGKKVILYEMKRAPLWYQVDRVMKMRRIWLSDVSADATKEDITKHLLAHLPPKQMPDRIGMVRFSKERGGRDAQVRLKSVDDIKLILDKVPMTELKGKRCWVQVEPNYEVKLEKTAGRLIFRKARLEKVSEMRKEMKRKKREKREAEILANPAKMARRDMKRRRAEGKKQIRRMLSGGSGVKPTKMRKVPVDSSQIKVLKEMGDLKLTKAEGTKLKNKKSKKQTKRKSKIKTDEAAPGDVFGPSY